jgi:hypothetical protein
MIFYKVFIILYGTYLRCLHYKLEAGEASGVILKDRTHDGLGG